MPAAFGLAVLAHYLNYCRFRVRYQQFPDTIAKAWVSHRLLF
jgi:hypothetical protein